MSPSNASSSSTESGEAPVEAPPEPAPAAAEDASPIAPPGDGLEAPATDEEADPAGDDEVVGELPPAAPPVELAPRYFEDATELVAQTIHAVEGEEIIGWAHDRIDPDTMGANGLMWLILREVFHKKYSCYYSKRMSFLMNRTLSTNFMPNGILKRCERTENMSEVALSAPLIIVLDATSPEIMTDFSHILRRNKELRKKPLLFIDHHRKGTHDLEDFPNARGVRYENAQATSAILLHVARNLGLDLRGTEEGFRLAVIARAGIDTDLIGVEPSGYSESTVAALDYLDEVLGERGQEILAKLASIKHPISWYRKLGQALAEVENYDGTIAVAGLGVIDDTGIVPFVANRLLEVGPFKTTIVFGLVYDRVEGQIISVDLDASGRSTQDTEIVLPDLFHDVFFVTAPDGRKTSKGGGRSNMLMGDFSGAGASVPLDYWRQLSTKSADEKITVLERLAWPSEFLRLRHLLTSRIHSLKPEEVRSLAPIPGLEDIE